MVTVVIDLNRVTEALMEARFLDPESDGRAALENALADYIDDFAESATRDARMRASRGIFRT